jgi:cell wall-associated NlpC family hydrolase
VTVEEKLDTAITMTELLYGQGVSDVRVDLVEYAKQFLGNPYVWGGTSLTKGADCSGFVMSVFKKYGVKLSHSSKAQANEGTKISTSELLPGDLIFYANSRGSINHVAIYIGGGQVIHASNPKTGIRISKYNYRTPAKCVRVLYD